ncbi:MAG TPA: hypothetical protein VD902_11440 [Symbiobacteriaceae bacterium]|nr:hypothetical protein [Symbiobacteriaceae bacterium]
MTTPVVILSDVAASEPGKRVAVLAVKLYERYAVPVQYWAELKNEPTATPAGYGPTLAAKWLAKEAARVAPGLVAASLQARQEALSQAQAAIAALPAVPDEGDDPVADHRTALVQQVAALQAEIDELTALQGIVDADVVPRIDAFYTGLLALIGPDDPRVEQYTQEWADTKMSFLHGPDLPAEL